MKATVSTRGLDDLLENLAKKTTDVDAVVQAALTESANVLQAEMKRLAPMDTGNLRDHIVIHGPVTEGNTTFVEVGVIHSRNLTDADTARYANVQEYGSSKTSAKSFVRSGTANAKARARKALVKALQEALQE